MRVAPPARFAIRCRFVVALVFATLAFSPTASALPKVALSIGQGFYVNNGTHPSPVQAELTGSWSFMIVQADLGVMQEFNKSKDFILTPGVRVNILSLYAKAGVPIRLTDGSDWGFRLGAGWTIFSLGIAGIFVEADAMFWKKFDFKDYVPITARVGVEFGF